MGRFPSTDLAATDFDPANLLALTPKRCLSEQEQAMRSGRTPG